VLLERFESLDNHSVNIWRSILEDFFVSFDPNKPASAARVGETDLSFVHILKQSDSVIPSQFIFIFGIVLILSQTNLVKVH
jgi:hypothetical protein